jgi:hypothetical protein
VSWNVAPRELLRTVLPPLLLAGVVTLLAYAATSPTTGFFFAGLVVVTLLTPPLVLAEGTRLQQLLCAASIISSVALVWLLALGEPSITASDWLRADAVLVGYGFALWGLAASLRRLISTASAGLTFSATVAQATTIAVALAWLAWPVWLSPWLAGHERLVGLLAAPHPLLALDAVLRASGPPWSERYFMYNFLTVLNQDVAYELPRSIVPSVLLHAVIGAIALLLGRGRNAARLEVDLPDRSPGGARERHVSEDLLP